MRALQIKNSEIKNKLIGLCPFIASSSSARMTGGGLDYYDVYSYEVLIAVYSFKKKMWVYFDSTKYSVITSTLQNLLKKVIGDTSKIKGK